MSATVAGVGDLSSSATNENVSPTAAAKSDSSSSATKENMGATAGMVGESIPSNEGVGKLSEEILKFLQANKIKCSDLNRLVEHFIKLGVQEFDDLENLQSKNLNEEDTGLKLIQQQRLLQTIQKHFSSRSSAALTHQSASKLYDEFGKGAVVESLNNPAVTVSVRYIFCRDLFSKEINERVLINLYLSATTIRDIFDLISSDEKIKDEYKLELFTHEGYPIVANSYNEDCTLLKWGFQEHSLLYAIVRRKDQEVVRKALDDTQGLDITKGVHTLRIHSVLYGTFSIAVDYSMDTGFSIKQRINGVKGLHPEHFKLSIRPKKFNSTTKYIDHWKNEEIKSLLESADDGDAIELMLTMLPLYSIRGGSRYFFGKCTYDPMVQQTDRGYSKFYSILYFLVHELSPSEQSQLLTFLHRECDFPPLTYALRVLFSEHSLEQLPSWVALIEGFYQLFSAMLMESFQVPNDRIFECSDYLFGMICTESEKIKESECIHWDSISLLCRLSHIKMVEPVTLPRCDGVFEKQIICQLIKSQIAVPGCDIKNISEDKIKRAEDMERLLMLSNFQPSESFMVWNVWTGMKRSLGPLHLPTAATWEYICNSKGKFQVDKPSDKHDLGYYEGNLVIITRIMKDVYLGREVYNPLYNPKENEGTFIMNKDDIDSQCSEEINLKNFVKPNIKSSWGSSVLQLFKRSNNGASTSDVASIRKEPSEAVVVVLDCSRSMNAPIFDDPTKHGQHMTRLTAAKELFLAFLNRTEGFAYHHVVGLVSCSKTPKVEVDLTDNYKLFKDRIKNLEISKGTALYDSMIRGSELLMGITKDYPHCKKRIFCLTDGEDMVSSCSIDRCFECLRQREILVDSVIIIGEKGNVDQKAISHGTGGFCFHPKSMPDALKIFETETILSSAARQIQQEALLENLSPYKNTEKYPYNLTDFYGQPDLRTQYAYEFSRGSYGNPARVVQHAALFSQKAERSNLRIQRILQEIQHYLREPHPDIDIYPQEDNICRWKIVLIGPEHTPYEKGTFILYAKFPEDYPHKPPEIRFETPIYHCNINSNGRICHASLDTKYVPRTKIKTLLEYIYGLLMAPEPLDPLDSVLALELHENEGAYKARARELVQKFAMGHDRTDIRKEIVKDNADAPSHLICPLTGKLFEDPVVTQYGCTYERKELMEYLSSNDSMDPLVKKPVSKERITPNLNLKELVNDYRRSLN